MKEKLWKYPLFFLACATVMCGLLILSAAVPRSIIWGNLERSAAYYSNYENFFELRAGAYETTVDYYADANLYNIIACMDSSHPVSSAMDAPCYGSAEVGGLDAFIAVMAGEEERLSYARYWHGSTVFITALLLITDAEGIYLIAAILMLLLTALLMLMLFRRKRWELMGGIALAILLCKGWIAACSLEYAIPCITALAVSILLLELDKWRKNTDWLWIFSGAFICFVDFLSTETLTLLIPLLIQTVLRFSRGTTPKECARNILRASLLWGGAYAAMWLIKWGLASAVLGRNVFSESLAQAHYRVNSNIFMQGGAYERYVGALIRNIRDVFPFCLVSTYGQTVLMLLGAAVVLTAVIFLFGRGGKRELGLIPCLLTIGAVPYVRFLALSAHSYVHSFFTYRAQMATVAALGICLWYILMRKSRS